MAQTQKLKIAGLYTHPDPYSEVPDGALSTADNVVINREGVISPRRGFAAQDHDIGSASDRANQLTEYQDKLLAQYGSGSLAYYDSSTGWQAYSGTYTPPTDSRMRFAQSNGNLYFTTNVGTKKLDAYDGSPKTVGVPKALGASLSLSGSGSWFTADNQVAYRIVWGIRDANDNVILGAPSQREILTNPSAGTLSDVDLTILIPDDITTSHFVQAYRSDLSGGESVVPNDELYLVYEANPTSAEITAGSLSFTDETPTDLVGETLYTSPSQQGILAANDQPPLAKDIAVFKSYLFYANTTGKHRYDVTLLGIGGTNGLAADDTITIGGVTYTAKTSEDIANNYFERATSGSAAQNIQDTAQSLVNVINQSASNTTVYAFYVSGPDDLPGQILIEERDFGGSSFNIQTNNDTAWDPDLTTVRTSSNDRWKNALFYSKLQQPEAVPLVNFIRVGSASDPILRIIPLRDGLFIFKQTEGIYRLYQSGGVNFAVDLFDSSTNLLAAETLDVLSNQIFGYFDQGICTVSENGVQVVSRPIEKSLLQLQGEALTQVKDYSWAVAYETDRKYILNLPSSSSDTHTTQAYVWDTFTRSWVRWVIEKECGFVRPSDNKLYVGDATDNRVSAERKNFSFKDHVDEAISVTINSISDLNITLADVSNISVGDVLWQSSTAYSNINAIDTSAKTVTVDYDPGFSTGSAEVRQAFTTTVEWVPFTAGAPMMMKKFYEFGLIFEQEPRDATISFSSELNKAVSEVSIDGSSTGGWGTFAWGTQPWGGEVSERLVRTYVTRSHSYAATLSVKWSQSVGYSAFALNGAQITYNGVGERTTR